VRAFIALELPAPTKTAIAAAIDTLHPRVRDVRWLSPETIHLTLRFLGETGDEALACLQPKLAAAAAACPVSTIHVRGVGLFPDHGSPRVLWLGTELPPALVRLQGDLEAAAITCGFPREDRPFRSHITLGRWRDRAPRPELPPLDLGAAAIQFFVLYKSALHPRGAIHTPITRFELTG
jgi:RNA 2',3'-cyclic 3'-phosphodiesterase